jgi:hypothetical protein
MKIVNNERQMEVIQNCLKERFGTSSLNLNVFCIGSPQAKVKREITLLFIRNFS